jgi:alpha-L-fucosidase
MLSKFGVAAILIVTLACGPLVKGDDAANRDDLPIADGPFKPTMDSLKQYHAPDWFRDAKFGIWAHWGPQAVPMEGDWYARKMYEQGSSDYNYHVAHYGHPSVFGYKDIIPLWKAEKWDPDHLMSLYKAAGAKYFVSMGSHHDNFFMWNSKLNPWNAVNMGPHRDVVGEWQKAATKFGLKFGVSEHLGASFTWFQASHGSDNTGPKAGVPYDGADPKYQDLYHFPAEPGDKGWYSNNPKWQHQWYTEIRELVDNYHPDLLYSDGPVPFKNEVGLSMITHLYNSNAALHDGKCEAVYNCKQISEGRWVQDLERGIMPTIDPNPWQTDTSIGDWFYNRHWKVRPVIWITNTLVDNVSKNGNLLLNVQLRPDGSLDPEVEEMLKQLADWSAIYGEAIFGSRPWLVYGESTVHVKGGSFHEDFKYDAHEIRFTTEGDVLYALSLGWPDDGKLTIRSLAKPDGQEVNHITSVSLLGFDGNVDWKQTADGLLITLPEKKVSELTAGLKITGDHLTNVPYQQSTAVVAGADGSFILAPEDADINGGIQSETLGGQSNLGHWDAGDDSAVWRVKFTKAGTYSVSTQTSSLAGADFVVEIGDQPLSASASATGDWPKFVDVPLGDVTIKEAGTFEVKLRAKDPGNWKPINVRAIVLTPR